MPSACIVQTCLPNLRYRLTQSYRSVSNDCMTTQTKINTPALTQGQLLSLAFCEIHRQGFQGASISNILESTKPTKGALYHHFPTKHALGLTVIDEIIAPRLETLLFRPLRDSTTPVATLLEILAGVASFMGDEGIMLGCPLNNLMQEMSPLDEKFRHHLNTILETWQQIISTALQHGQENNIVKPDVDCDATALFIVSAWEGCFSIAKNKQPPDSFKLCMKQLHGYVQSLMI